MTTELAPRDNVVEMARPQSGLALSFAEMTMRVAQLDQFYREVMQEGTDFGVIPGTAKPSLYQPGAQLLDQIFGLVPSFEVAPASVIDWQRPIPFFHYVVRCRLLSRRGGELAAEAIGSCNSHEDRYRWRTSKKVCPQCGIEAIGRSKAEYGGGYFCNAKQGGCGGRFRPNSDEAADLEQQQAGKVENADTASLENTILKMAQKRAHVAATLNATGASRIFTQDIEDLPQFQAALRVDAVVEQPRVRDVPANPPTEVIEDAPPKPTLGWTPALTKRWRALVAEAGALGIGDLIEKAPPDDATREQVAEAGKRLGAAVNARGSACIAFDVLTKQCLDIGIDVEILDPKTLAPDALAETHAALNEMYQAALKEAGAQTETEEAF